VANQISFDASVFRYFLRASAPLRFNPIPFPEFPMPLTLIKETGAGLSNANSYASAADGDAYHDAHVYATAWTGATTANKEKALVMATRLIDAHYLFYGTKLLKTQALMWPRFGAPDADHAGGREFIADNEIPLNLVNATCELARELLLQDRTAAPDGEGLSQAGIVGILNVTFDKRDTRPVISHETRKFLSKLGYMIDRAAGRLVRT
jgi:hypothetical protein